MAISKFFLSFFILTALAAMPSYAVMERVAGFDDPPGNPADSLANGIGDSLSEIKTTVIIENTAQARLATAESNEYQEFVSKVTNNCERFKNQYCGVGIDPGFHSFDHTQTLEKIMSLNIPGVNQLDRAGVCSCLKETVNAQPDELGQLKSQLKSQLRSQVNKKLLNDFSSHLEDIHYFFYASKDFRKNILLEKNDFSVSGEILCTNKSIFKDAIRKSEKCKPKKFKESEMEEEIAAIFGALGMSTANGLQTTINHVKNDILMSNKKSSDCSPAQPYSRFCHDQQRHNISQSPAGKNADRFLTNVLKSPMYQKTISTYSENYQVSPLAAMALVLSKDLKEQTPDLIKLVDPEMLGADLYKSFEDALKAKKLSSDLQRKVFEKINKIISVGVDAHPGLDRILKDKKLFDNTAKDLKSLSVMSYLEKNINKMNEHFSESCQQLAVNIAETVCSSDDELLSSVGDKDFYEYIQFMGGKDERTKQVTAVIACENSGISSPHMTNLVLDSNLRKTSDYFDIKNGGNSNLYSTLEKGRGDQGSDLSKALNKVNTIYGGSFSLDDVFDDDFFETGAGPRIKRKEVADFSNASLESQNEAQNESSLFNRASNRQDNLSETINTEPGFYTNTTVNNSIAPTQSDVTSAAESKFAPRQAFRDFLSQRQDQEVVDELMANTSDEMMQELMELKKEMEENEQRIRELTSENEKLKLDSLRRKMESLQNERAALEPGEPARNRQNNSVVRRDTPLNTAAIGRNLPAASPVETGGINSGSGAAFSNQNSANGASLSGLNNALLSSAGGGRSPASNAFSNPVIVPASSARSGSLEIQSQEVGLDLLNYLSNNGSDIQTLINLKTSGIIYKYRTLVNGRFVEKEVLIEYTNLNEDVKKIIDKKIAQNENRSKEILRLDNEIKELQRIASYSTLQMILAEQMRDRIK